MLKAIGFVTVTALAATGALTLIGTAFATAAVLHGMTEPASNRGDAKTA